MNPKRPRSPDSDTASYMVKTKKVHKRYSLHPPKLAETNSKDAPRAERSMTTVHKKNENMKEALQAERSIATVHKKKESMKDALRAERSMATVHKKENIDHPPQTQRSMATVHKKKERIMGKGQKAIRRQTERPSTKVYMAADGGLAGDTVTRKSGRTKPTTNYNIDDAYPSLDSDTPEKEHTSAIVAPRNKVQHISTPRVEVSDDWDTNDESLLQTSCTEERRLYRICQKIFGDVPDMLLPEGEFINEAGPGLYTKNWNAKNVALMQKLVFCPLFQQNRAALQYAISLAIHHRVPVREKPHSDVLFVTPGVYRVAAFAFVEKIPEVVESQNQIRANKKLGVVSRDLSAVIDSWNLWAIEELVLVKAWNKANPDKPKDIDGLYKELKYYQHAHKLGEKGKKKQGADPPLMLKKNWIINQRKKYPRVRQKGRLERAAIEKQQESIVKTRPAGGRIGQGGGTTENKYMRTAPNSIKYMDLTIDSDEENDE